MTRDELEIIINKCLRESDVEIVETPLTTYQPVNYAAFDNFIERLLKELQIYFN